MKAECNDVENALSYYRRLAQARIEILEAEHDRRARGGTVEDLVKDLPRILSAESGRSSITDTRVPPPDAPGLELHWPDGREELIVDTTLANLPVLPADELESTLDAPARLRARALRPPHGDARRHRHASSSEIAARQVAGTAG